MIRGLRVIEGLGGTGKTHAILDAAREIARGGDDSLYLCFNRPLRESTRGKLSGSRTEAYTIHGFAFRALAELGRLPRELDGVGGEDEISKKKAFEKLLAAFHTTFVDEGVMLPVRLRRYRHVFIDEYQNLDDDLLRTVSDIATLLDAELHLTGDPLQVGYGFQEKYGSQTGQLRANKGDLRAGTRREGPAHREPPERARDRIVHRRLPREGVRREEHPTIQADGRLRHRKHGGPAQDRDLRTGERRGGICYRFDPEDSRSRQRCFYRHPLAVRPRPGGLPEGEDRGPRVAISTIHSSIGREAEHVFLVAFQDPISQKNDPREEHEERCIAYTALIRARKSLTVSTSYPNLAPERWFDPETCEIAVRDIERSKPYGRFPKIRGNANYSRRKYDLASIDSIIAKSPFEAVPFFPYIEKAQGKRSKGKYDQNKGDKTSSFMKREIRNDQGVQVAISYHTSHRYYEFTLSDTNLLHRSGFTDSPRHQVPDQLHLRSTSTDGSGSTTSSSPGSTSTNCSTGRGR